jgi:hypothetical protein
VKCTEIFFQNFKKVRTEGFEILDIGKRGIADRFRIYDSVLNLRLHGALVEITDNGQKKKSSENGIVDFSHELMPQGNYSATVVLREYGKLTINNIPAFDDKMTTIDVPLEKGGADKVVNFHFVEGGRGLAN